MSNFMNAMQTNDARTENGAVTHSTSGTACLDWFFTAGALRRTPDEAVTLFSRAFGENQEVATRILMWARDVRGGAGERNVFRTVFAKLCNEKPDLARAVMFKVPALGRWDDLVVAFGTQVQADAEALWLNALVNERNGLAAKWTPREKSANGHVFKALAKAADIKNKQLRKILSMLSDTVEQKMCAREWDAIEFGKLPSVASARYQKAFGRNAQETYTQYIQGLEKGTEKINAGAVYPYDIVKSVNRGDARVADAQWKALPNYMEGSDERIMPIVDVSGSMQTPINAGTGSVTCKDVAMSLGIYIAERNEGIFQNQFISFSSDPHFHALKGATLHERLMNMDRSGENMSTDVNKVFRVLLQRAVQAGLSQEDLPTKMLILSDMEFDQAGAGYWGGGQKTNLEVIKQEYARAGYEMPQLVFWNLRGRIGNVPVKSGEVGTALVSGCSPSILTNLLGGELEPVKIMMQAVGNERYDLEFFRG
ncbi:RNA-binding protein [Vibrio phage D479]